MYTSKIEIWNFESTNWKIVVSRKVDGKMENCMEKMSTQSKVKKKEEWRDNNMEQKRSAAESK